MAWSNMWRIGLIQHFIIMLHGDFIPQLGQRLYLVLMLMGSGVDFVRRNTAIAYYALWIASYRVVTLV